MGTALFTPEAAGSPPSSPRLSTANEGSGLAVWEGRKKEDFLTPAGLSANSLGEEERGAERASILKPCLRFGNRGSGAHRVKPILI